MVFKILICLIIGYGFGCISTGYLVGKAYHIDIRKYGSGNAGTTNALRTLGWKAGALTYLGDFIKAIVPILIFRNIIFADLEYSTLLGLYTGLGVVLGHNYPFWLRFKGGKGIAVTSGVMAAFDPLLIPVFVLVFCTIVAITRYVSLGSLVVSMLFPIWIGFTHKGDIHMLVIGILYTVSAFYTHRANIKRLLQGTENKFGQKVKVDRT